MTKSFNPENAAKIVQILNEFCTLRTNSILRQISAVHKVVKIFQSIFNYSRKYIF